MTMERQEEGGLALGPRQVGLGLLAVFVVVLAVVIGNKMSAEAMAVVIGVVCGVAAGIPTSLLLWVALTRREQGRIGMDRRSGTGAYPPVVVIQGGGSPTPLPPGMGGGGYWAGVSSAPPPVERQFHVVGEDLLLDDGNV